jgi:hypothetical protein
MLNKIFAYIFARIIYGLFASAMFMVTFGLMFLPFIFLGVNMLFLFSFPGGIICNWFDIDINTMWHPVITWLAGAIVMSFCMD